MIKKMYLVAILSIRIFACFPDSSIISITFNKGNIKFNKDEIKKLGLKYNIRITFYKNYKNLSINYVEFYSLSKNDIRNSYNIYKKPDNDLEHASIIDKSKIIKILDLSYQKRLIKNLSIKDLEDIKKNIGVSLIIFYLPRNCKVDKKMYNSMLHNGKYLYVKNVKDINQKKIQDQWYGFANDYQIMYYDNCPEIVK